MVNYPYDDGKQGVAAYSKSPDDSVFQQIALSYAKVKWQLKPGVSWSVILKFFWTC